MNTTNKLGPAPIVPPSVAEQRETNQPTTPCAVEWAEKRLFIQWDDDGNPQWYLYKTDALKLARRADEAEAERKSLAVDFSNMHDEVLRLTTQLAAAQAQVSEHRKYLAAAQAEARELREELQQTVVFCEAHIELFKAGKRLNLQQLWEDMKVRAHNARALIEKNNHNETNN